jgi:hypothetical protein
VIGEKDSADCFESYNHVDRALSERHMPNTMEHRDGPLGRTVICALHRISIYTEADAKWAEGLTRRTGITLPKWVMCVCGNGS